MQSVFKKLYTVWCLHRTFRPLFIMGLKQVVEMVHFLFTSGLESVMVKFALYWIYSDSLVGSFSPPSLHITYSIMNGYKHENGNVVWMGHTLSTDLQPGSYFSLRLCFLASGIVMFPGQKSSFLLPKSVRPQVRLLIRWGTTVNYWQFRQRRGRQD